MRNQGVWAWAYDPDDPDPDPGVYDRENEDGVPWTSSGTRLSTFLLQATVFEAVIGTEPGASAAWVGAAQLDAILRPLGPLPGPTWNWPPPGGSRLYAGDGLLAFAGPNEPHDGEPSGPDPAWSVFIAARKPDQLDYLSAVPGVVWDKLPPQQAL